MNASGASVKADADRLADFVLFTQRSCILNLSTELNKGNVSFPQFFLLTYLSSEEYLTIDARHLGDGVTGCGAPFTAEVFLRTASSHYYLRRKQLQLTSSVTEQQDKIRTSNTQKFNNSMKTGTKQWKFILN